MGRPLRSIPFLAVLAGLSGCGWFGETDAPALPGQRIAVLQASRNFEADPGLADQPVRLPRPQRNAEWSQAGGFPDHANHHLELADTVREAWRASAGSGSSGSAHLLAPPVVMGGRVFTIDTDGDVYAFNASNGQRVWAASIAPKDDSGSVVSGGISADTARLYAATGFAQVVAFDLASGKEIWRQPLPAPSRAAPTISGDRLFVTTVDNQTIALAADDGRRLWAHSGISETAGLLGGSSPAVDGGTVVAPYTSGELFALRADTGRVAWSDNLAATRRIDAVSALADIRGRPVIDRGLVVAVSHSGRAAGIDLRSGNRVWERELAGTHMPWVAGDYIYLLTTTGDLVCLTRRDGRVRWVTTLPRFENPERQRGPISWSGPVLASDRLILVGTTGEALAVSPYTGEALGRMRLPGRTVLAPVVADGTLYVLTDDATLVAYR